MLGNFRLSVIYKVNNPSYSMPSRPIINLPKTLQDFRYHHYFTGVFCKISLDKVNLAYLLTCMEMRVASLFTQISGLIYLEWAFDKILFVHTMM